MLIFEYSGENADFCFDGFFVQNFKYGHLVYDGFLKGVLNPSFFITGCRELGSADV
jgi:hypothetical protein